MRTDRDGRGMVNILVADKLMQSPRLYATFLLWMLSELFEELPEVGDPPKPKLVFFFDEAHLLFNDAPKALMDKIEQVVRLIRSKGVGVYFVTQNPIDVPDTVLGQLGNRVQHALRAFTPRDQKAVAAAAQTFRPNPKLDTAQVIMELGKGEALVSFLEGNGTPAMVERVMIRPPSARIGPITPEERKAIMDASPVKGKYDTAIDAESAYEIIAEARGRHRGAGRGSAAAVAAFSDRSARSSAPSSAPMSARPAVDRPADRAQRHALGHQQGGRRRGRRSRQIGRRLDRWFGRPRAGARRARRPAAAMRSFSFACRMIFLICGKCACAEISVVASAARYSVPDLLPRADRRRPRPGNLGPRQDQGLSALVLGRAAGAAGQEISIPAIPASISNSSIRRCRRCCWRSRLFRQDPALSLSVVAQRRGVVDDRRNSPMR